MRIPDQEAIRRSNTGFKEQLAAKVAELDSSYEDFLEKHIRNIIDEHVGQKTEEARVEGESAAQVNAEISAKAATDLKKKKTATKAKNAEKLEKTKKNAGTKLEFARRLELYFEYLDEHNLENGPGGRFVRSGESSADGTKPNEGSGSKSC